MDPHWYSTDLYPALLVTADPGPDPGFNDHKYLEKSKKICNLLIPRPSFRMSKLISALLDPTLIRILNADPNPQQRIFS